MHAPEITRLLHDVEAGQDGAFDRLLARVYPELRDIARGRLREQRDGHTFAATDLVHEAYLRLVQYQEVAWRDRLHFFGAASQTMRRVLVDYARKQAADKRRGLRVSLTEAGPGALAVSFDQLLEIDAALDRLAVSRPRWVRIVESRFFGGLTIEETAELLGVSHTTVSNDWALARGWLRRELEG